MKIIGISLLLISSASGASVLGWGETAGAFLNPTFEDARDIPCNIWGECAVTSTTNRIGDLPLVSPVPGTEFISGVGTDYVVSGAPYLGAGVTPSSFRFEGIEFKAQPKGEPFVAGYIHFTNGVTAQGSAIDEFNHYVRINPGDPRTYRGEWRESVSTVFSTIELLVGSISNDPEFYQFETLELVHKSTTNTGDAFESADLLYFANRPDLGSFRVFEQNTASVEILMEFNSLHLAGFGDVITPNSGFISSSIDPYIITNPMPTASPALLILVGIFGIAGVRTYNRPLKFAA